MELLKRYSEDIPEVALDIVSKSADIADLVTKLGANNNITATYDLVIYSILKYLVSRK